MAMDKVNVYKTRSNLSSVTLHCLLNVGQV
jgi:hypothetical protein